MVTLFSQRRGRPPTLSLSSRISGQQNVALSSKSGMNAAPAYCHVVKILSDHQLPCLRNCFLTIEDNFSCQATTWEICQFVYFILFEANIQREKPKYLQGRHKGKFTMEGGKYSKWRPFCCGNQSITNITSSQASKLR